MLAVTRTLLTLILVALAMSLSNCIMFKLTSNEPTCLQIPGGNTYVIEYVSSGDSDRNVKLEVYDNDQFLLRK